MARFTSIGMPKKTFVASAAEETRAPADPVLPPQTGDDGEAVAGPSKKKTHRAGRAHRKRKVEDVEGDLADVANVEGATQQSGTEQKAKAPGPKSEKKAWGRDEAVAKRAKFAADRSEARRVQRQEQKSSQTTCFACRGVGHSAKECPNVLLSSDLPSGGSSTGTAGLLNPDSDSGLKVEQGATGLKRGKGKSGGEVTSGKCYRCNSTNHSLSQCRKPADPENPTPFATCYICLASGHLSALCPSNPKGVYIKGGSCKVCGSVKHRAKDCPDDKWKPSGGEAGISEDMLGETAGTVGADEDDFIITAREKARSQAADGASKGSKRKKHAPNNNGVRGLYLGGQKGGADGEAAQVESSAGPAQLSVVQAPRALPQVAKAKAKVVTF